jgi:hypothetical protein
MRYDVIVGRDYQNRTYGGVDMPRTGLCEKHHLCHSAARHLQQTITSYGTFRSTP